VVGGTINALAGGGTFLVFPTLLLTGVPAVPANATTSVALTPGVASSALAYRHELGRAERRLPLAVASIIGGTVGAIVLLRTPSHVFETLVPYLLLFAILLYAFGPTLTRRLGSTGAALSRRQAAGHLAVLLTVQLVIALYGGYFGGGIGILMLAVFSLFGMKDFHRANALRTMLAACINSAAIIAFIIAGAVAWPQAIVMLVGAIIGGYGGVRLFRHVPGLILRRIVIAMALVMTVYLFIRAYH